MSSCAVYCEQLIGFTFFSFPASFTCFSHFNIHLNEVNRFSHCELFSECLWRCCHLQEQSMPNGVLLLVVKVYAVKRDF